MKRYFFTCLLLLSSLYQAAAQDQIINPVFKSGEKLGYKLKYGIFTAAEAHLRVEDSPVKFDNLPGFHIIADGFTAGTFDIFYKVRNRYESFVDQKTLIPNFYTENRHESNYKHTDKVTFDHDKNVIRAMKGNYPFSGKVFDFVSAYYFARCIDVSKLKIGEKIELRYFLEDGIQSLTVTYLGKEQVQCPVGTFNCLKFNPTIIPGRIFRKDSKLYLWITDDNNRIPIKAHVELIVGSLTMDLISTSGLKYPLNPVPASTE